MEFIAAVSCLLFLLFQASRAVDVVLAPEPSPDFPLFPAPAPTSGADDVAAPPSPMSRAPGPAPTPWVDSGPLEPKEKSTPGPASAPSSETGGSIPFISSSPAVPLPVGETDTATILPFPTPGSQNRVVGMSSSSSCDAVGVPSLMLLIMPAFASLCLAFVG